MSEPELVLTDLQVLCAQAITSGITRLVDIAAILSINPKSASALAIRTAQALGVSDKGQIAKAYGQNVYRIRVVPASRRNHGVRQVRSEDDDGDSPLVAADGFKWPDYGPHHLRMRS